MVGMSYLAEIAQRIHKSVFLLSLMILSSTISCGPAPTSATVIIPTSTSTPFPTAQPTEPLEPTFPPSVTFTPFVSRGVIRIFSQSPLSGDHAFFGKDILHGAELAVLQLGGPLSALGYQMGLSSYDDRNAFETARSNAKTIAANPEILCGVGHYDSTITTETSNIYHEAGLPIVVPSDTDAILTDRWYLEINRVIGRIDGQGKAGALFAKDQGFASTYIISANEENALKNAEYFRLDADRLGIQVLGMVITSLTEENVRSIIGRLMDSRPDLVYISSPASQAIPFLEEARAAGYVGAFLGTEALNNPPLINFAHPSLVDGGGMYYTITSPPASYYPEAAKFIADFKTYFDASPLLFAARAYDAAGICLRAIEEASKAIGGGIPTRAQVANAIRALKGYQGITGTYTFNFQGDPTLVRYYVYKVVYVDAANWNQNYISAAYDVIPP